MTARGLALNYMLTYQKASLLPSFKALESYMDATYPGFLDLWGQAAGRVNGQKLSKALVDLAKRNGMSYPTRPDLNQMLFDIPASDVSLITAIQKGSAEAASDIASAGANIFKIGGPILIVLGGIYFAWQAGLLKGKA